MFERLISTGSANEVYVSLCLDDDASWRLLTTGRMPSCERARAAGGRSFCWTVRHHVASRRVATVYINDVSTSRSCARRKLSSRPPRCCRCHFPAIHLCFDVALDVCCCLVKRDDACAGAEDTHDAPPAGHWHWPRCRHRRRGFVNINKRQLLNRQTYRQRERERETARTTRAAAAAEMIFRLLDYGRAARRRTLRSFPMIDVLPSVDAPPPLR